MRFFSRIFFVFALVISYFRHRVKKQKKHFNPNPTFPYGGVLQKTRKGRRGPRPLHTRFTMHFVLRSSKAVGKWSFRQPQNRQLVRRIFVKFSNRFRVQIIMSANVGNHLHIQLRIESRENYKRFIRAVTGAVVMAITKVSRHKPGKMKFWDYRPYSTIVTTIRYEINLNDYIRINQLEGEGYTRVAARFIVKNFSSS